MDLFVRRRLSLEMGELKVFPESPLRHASCMVAGAPKSTSRASALCAGGLWGGRWASMLILDGFLVSRPHHAHTAIVHLG